MGGARPEWVVLHVLEGCNGWWRSLVYAPLFDFASLCLLGHYHSVCSLQFDNLNAAHETTKLEMEASHSEKVELLKKTYETSLSGKGAFPASGDGQWKCVVIY